nr:LysR substrate-binding domain-containing protein [Burkholderia stabilis]
MLSRTSLPSTWHGTVYRTRSIICARKDTGSHYSLTLGARHAGREYPDGDGYAALPLPCAIQANRVQTYHAAGLAGLGLIQAGYPTLAHHVESGALVEVLPEPLTASLVVAHRRNLSPLVRAFMDWIEDLEARPGKAQGRA